MAEENINIIITKVGLAEIINAEHDGTAPVKLSNVKFTNKYQEVTEDTTELTDICADLTTISGGDVGDNVIHIVARDGGSESYTVYGFGVYSEKGTLIAVYSQESPIIQKTGVSQAHLAIDIAINGFNPESITFGDANFFNPPATTKTPGVIQIATDDEVKLGTDGTKAVTPATLNKHLTDNLGLSLEELPEGGYGKALSDLKDTFAKGKVEFVDEVPEEPDEKTLYLTPFDGEVF